MSGAVTTPRPTGWRWRRLRSAGPLRRKVAAAALVAVAACGGTQTPCETDVGATEERGSSAGALTAAHAQANLTAVAWLQGAAEARALSVQTYAQAALALERKLAAFDLGAASPAVVLDLDETVLDNSPYQAWLLHSGQAFSDETWDAWCDAREATAVPGALEFVQGALGSGVAVYFVSNRSAAVEQATRENLAALGFGEALLDDIDTVLLKGERPEWRSAKSTRLAHVAVDHTIVMLVGDNLGDFTDDYLTSPDARAAFIDDNRGRWGEEWIMLPNPTYGSWLSALFGHDWSTPAAAQTDAVLQSLRVWEGP